MTMDITMKLMQCMIFRAILFTLQNRVYGAATYDGYFSYAPSTKLYNGLSTFIYGMYCIFCSSFVCFWSFWKFWEWYIMSAFALCFYYSSEPRRYAVFINKCTRNNFLVLINVAIH
ncbi:hypothetical protein V1523DRAFT_96055 [Lipomyces doorenjongii]